MAAENENDPDIMTWMPVYSNRNWRLATATGEFHGNHDKKFQRFVPIALLFEASLTSDLLRYALSDPMWGASVAPLTPGPISLIFMQYSGKIWPHLHL